MADKTNICGEDQCACNEDAVNRKQQLRKADMISMLAIATMAFLTGFGFTNNTNEMLFAKKYTAISCYSKIDIIGNLSNTKLPGDKNNKNNCSHQQGSLCETNSSRRKSLIANHCNT